MMHGSNSANHYDQITIDGEPRDGKLFLFVKMSTDNEDVFLSSDL